MNGKFTRYLYGLIVMKLGKWSFALSSAVLDLNLAYDKIKEILMAFPSITQVIECKTHL